MQALDGSERLLGVLMLQTRFPRPLGDIGHPATFAFEVRRSVVEGATPDRVVRDADPALLQPFIATGPGLAVRGTFSPARARRPAVVARSAERWQHKLHHRSPAA